MAICVVGGLAIYINAGEACRGDAPCCNRVGPLALLQDLAENTPDVRRIRGVFRGGGGSQLHNLARIGRALFIYQWQIQQELGRWVYNNRGVYKLHIVIQGAI